MNPLRGVPFDTAAGITNGLGGNRLRAAGYIAPSDNPGRYAMRPEPRCR